jgi:predicted dehydrogenase
MTDTYRVAVIGFAHSHVVSLMDSFAAQPNVEFIAAADTVPQTPSVSEYRLTRKWNLRRAREVIGISNIYDDWQELLVKERPDIVICCAENAQHADVTQAAASVGAHVILEKPMAASYADALRMTEATRAAGVRLMTNWPTAWSPALREAHCRVQQGDIGHVFQFKWRGGSLGPRKELPIEERALEWWYQKSPGGGAFLDYCCYGANLSRWLLGQPAESVIAMMDTLVNTWGEADDNAVLVVRFPRAMAILEGTWSTVDHGLPRGPILYGSEGTIVGTQQEGTRGIRIIRERGAEGEFIAGTPLQEGHRSPAEHLLHCLETGEPLHETLAPELNLQAQAILEAGRRSAETGQLVRPPS